MGRNILSICDECKVYIFHLRGKESHLIQRFQNDHGSHEKETRIVSDYVYEQPDNYLDVTDSYDASPNTPLESGGKLEKRRIIDDLVDFDEPDSSMVSGWGYNYEKAADYVLALIAKRERAAVMAELNNLSRKAIDEWEWGANRFLNDHIKALEQEGK